MHSKIDKDRDEIAKRKKMHSKIDKDRDQAEKRRQMHAQKKSY